MYAQLTATQATSAGLCVGKTATAMGVASSLLSASCGAPWHVTVVAA
jgi:hypothetical protein